MRKPLPPIPRKAKPLPPIPSKAKPLPPIPREAKPLPPIPTKAKALPPIPTKAKALPPIPSKAKPLPPTPTKPTLKPAENENRVIETAPRSEPSEQLQPIPKVKSSGEIEAQVPPSPEQKLTKRQSVVLPAAVTATDSQPPPIVANEKKTAPRTVDPRIQEIIDASAGYFRPSRPMQVLPSTGFTPKMKANITAFGTFMKTHPAVGTTLKDEKVGFDFRSTNYLLDGFGGAALMNDNKIHLSDEVINRDQVYFMRTVVHEIGHGSLQNLLFQKKPGSDLLEARNQDGQVFNDAWKILAKAGNNKYFFVTDLDNPKAPGASPQAYGAGRQVYLAKDVNEFTAESFMHMALERDGLNAHVNNLLMNDGVPAEVKDAWKRAKGVLDKYQDVLLKPN